MNALLQQCLINNPLHLSVALTCDLRVFVFIYFLIWGGIEVERIWDGAAGPWQCLLASVACGYSVGTLLCSALKFFILQVVPYQLNLRMK